MIYLHQWTTQWFRQFARVLFSRNFAYRVNKTLAKISEFTVWEQQWRSTSLHRLFGAFVLRFLGRTITQNFNILASLCSCAACFEAYPGRKHWIHLFSCWDPYTSNGDPDQPGCLSYTMALRMRDKCQNLMNWLSDYKERYEPTKYTGWCDSFTSLTIPVANPGFLEIRFICIKVICWFYLSHENEIISLNETKLFHFHTLF